MIKPVSREEGHSFFAQRWRERLLDSFQHQLSYLAGRLSECTYPWIKNLLIRMFTWWYAVDMSACIRQNPLDYTNFNAFFLRLLKPQARPIDADANVIISPVDGHISQIGIIEDNRLIQAKSIFYTLERLIGGDSVIAEPFKQGHFITLYLAPKDYHRVHMPVSGQLQQMIYVPGSLFPVNRKYVRGTPQLFTRNERVISIFETPTGGKFAIIQVGAFIVSGISTVWAGKIASAGLKKVQHWHYYTQKKTLPRGEEMGHFQLGSTVILLLSPGQIYWHPHLKVGSSVLFGQSLGSCNPSYNS